jgi:hypothetical protein
MTLPEELFFSSEIPEDVQEKWESFVSATLADCNKKNTVDLVSKIFYSFFPHLDCIILNNYSF